MSTDAVQIWSYGVTSESWGRSRRNRTTESESPLRSESGWTCDAKADEIRTPPTYSGIKLLNESDGQHIASYRSELGDQLVAEAAEIVRSLGFMAAHVVLIGGLVPGLLVPVLDPGIQPHVGTADIDLCLSLALVEGDTAAYERIETVLKGLGFEEGDVSFRWLRYDGVGLMVEFFCPAGKQRPPGRVFRPSQSANPTGKHKLGGRLSALALEAGELLTTDVEVISRIFDLPRNKGSIEMALRVTGLR